MKARNACYAFIFVCPSFLNEFPMKCHRPVGVHIVYSAVINVTILPWDADKV